MPSFQDSAVLIVLALLLFGPKGLAKLARQLGKLMGEFRRASNDFRMQMEEEFRLEEQADKQKKIDAMQAAAPVTAPLPVGSDLPEPPHPHMPPDPPLQTEYAAPDFVVAVEPLPIASEGSLAMMPPATGLPQPRSAAATHSVSDAFNAIPHAPAETVREEHEAAHQMPEAAREEPEAAREEPEAAREEQEAAVHG